MRIYSTLEEIVNENSLISDVAMTVYEEYVKPVLEEYDMSMKEICRIEVATATNEVDMFLSNDIYEFMETSKDGKATVKLRILSDDGCGVYYVIPNDSALILKSKGTQTR